MREALASGLLPYLHCPGVKPHKRKAPMKIMIVDDNRQMRRMIVSLIDDLVEEIIECGRKAAQANMPAILAGYDRLKVRQVAAHTN